MELSIVPLSPDMGAKVYYIVPWILIYTHIYYSYIVIHNTYILYIHIQTITMDDFVLPNSPNNVHMMVTTTPASGTVCIVYVYYV